MVIKGSQLLFCLFHSNTKNPSTLNAVFKDDICILSDTLFVPDLVMAMMMLRYTQELFK